MDEPRYDLYYVPEFPIEGLHWRRPPGDKALADFVDTMTAHIERFGLRNPPCVHRRKGRFDVRPGKCRVTAYQRLGRDHIPVILVDYDQAGPEPGWTPLPHDATFIQNKYLSGDCVIELSRRFANIKKSVDVVNRPGVENTFAKELREAGD